MDRVASTLALLLAAFGVVQRAGTSAPAEEAVKYPYQVVPKDALRGHLMQGPFREPGGVAFDEAAREVYVADTKNALVGIFDEQGTPVFTFGGRNLLDEPREIQIGPEGTIYVLDNDRDRVKAFSYRGEPLEPLRFTIPGEDGEEEPVRVATFALGPDGAWYVGDLERARVLIYTEELELELSLPTEMGKGKFEVVTAIAVSSEGKIAVTDYRATPVQVFDRSGRLVAAFGERSIGLDGFTLPTAVAFDEDGFLYVVDMLRHDVKIFDVQGGFGGTFGGWYSPETRGRGPGEMLYPNDIAIAPGGGVYVSERFGNRVQVFQRIPRVDPDRSRRAPADQPVGAGSQG